MAAQVGALIEATLADGALVWRLLQMGDLVHGERARLAETLAAVAALERLLLGVYVTVVAQMILSPECLAADVARVRPLIGVCAFVYEQVVRLGEVAVAVLADELLLGADAGTGRSASQLHGRGQAKACGGMKWVECGVGAHVWCTGGCWHGWVWMRCMWVLVTVVECGTA